MLTGPTTVTVADRVSGQALSESCTSTSPDAEPAWKAPERGFTSPWPITVNSGSPTSPVAVNCTSP